MDIQAILGMTDHTLLRVGCKKEEIAQLCEDAVAYRCASVCIPPYFVPYAKECIGGRNGVKVCTVIGFPNGYSTGQSKAYEALEAKEAGADEVDMVINMSLVKDRDWNRLREEIGLVRKACEGIILKVIVETCLLTDDEKAAVSKIVTECKADYIKTSTGFSTGGATEYDVAFLRKHVGKEVGVKASGGIHSLEEAQAMIDAGANRIGASSVVEAAKEKGI